MVEELNALAKNLANATEKLKSDEAAYSRSCGSCDAGNRSESADAMHRNHAKSLNQSRVAVAECIEKLGECVTDKELQQHLKQKVRVIHDNFEAEEAKGKKKED